ncbi:MAG: GntR family transcriptional regulator [Ruminococcaceae bacterium]|nr:GntR family transcriptional regulator [Oscillospiraceae bacterium]
MAWTFSGREAVYIQIADIIRQDIFKGKYPLGSQLPTVRQLAAEAAVNPNTMQRALLSLEDEGLLYSKGTVGRFVTDDEAVLLEAKERMIKASVRQLLDGALSLGISPQALAEYIMKEQKEERDECSDN